LAKANGNEKGKQFELKTDHEGDCCSFIAVGLSRRIRQLRLKRALAKLF
jgi:hypothetical protein